ncbi:hypothetical protein [Tardiphaga sp.]|jgi:hypothetical protein|uniref:hypothetical protein n=1 Tax=Tardiphaga sp. TaxID=1926292 RepID=UPI0037DA5C8B
MNLRTLKKLSKRAAPMLPLLGDERKQFPAEKWDNYSSSFIAAHKHWERSTCHPTYEGRNGWTTPRGKEILWTTKDGRSMYMRPPSHPRKGTVMVGAVTGYYEPEWDEETAWCALETCVRHHFCDWDEDGPTPTRTFSRPGDLLDAAQEIIAERAAAQLARDQRRTQPAQAPEPDNG